MVLNGGIRVFPRIAPAFLATVGLSLFSFGITPVWGQFPSVTPEEVGLSSERLARVSEAFEGYADDGRIAGAVGLVARHGKLAWAEAWGMRDLAAGDPMETDDIFRIFSMTKPITSVAVMMLWEEGHFRLDDRIGRYLPELGNMVVADLERSTSPDGIVTVPAERQITIRDLLRHTSGLSYGLTFGRTAADQAFARANPTGQTTLAEMVTELGKLPLAQQPGTGWRYSAATDVLGRLVEVISGQAFDVFLDERIFEPLSMDDTAFFVPDSKQDRFTQLYGHSRSDRALELRGGSGDYSPADTFFSGGSGLVSTAQDYARLAQMLLNGGHLDGAQILGRKTIELMTTDHLGDDGASFLQAGWGFGLGFTMKNQPALDGNSDSVGNYFWMGIAGTSFWVDPEEDLIGVFMIQIRPNRDIGFRQQFKRLVYQAVVS